MTDESEAIVGNHSTEIPDSTGEVSEENEPLTTEEILGWAEFCCWTVVILIPFLLYVNGPAVSFDQLVVRWALSIVAVTGGISLTARRLAARRKSGD